MSLGNRWWSGPPIAQGRQWENLHLTDASTNKSNRTTIRMAILYCRCEIASYTLQGRRYAESAGGVRRAK